MLYNNIYRGNMDYSISPQQAHVIAVWGNSGLGSSHPFPYGLSDALLLPYLDPPLQIAQLPTVEMWFCASRGERYRYSYKKAKKGSLREPKIEHFPALSGLLHLCVQAQYLIDIQNTAAFSTFR